VGDRLTRWPVCHSRSNASRATDHIQGVPQVAEQLDPVRCESERSARPCGEAAASRFASENQARGAR